MRDKDECMREKIGIDPEKMNAFEIAAGDHLCMIRRELGVPAPEREAHVLEYYGRTEGVDKLNKKGGLRHAMMLLTRVERFELIEMLEAKEELLDKALPDNMVHGFMVDKYMLGKPKERREKLFNQVKDNDPLSEAAFFHLPRIEKDLFTYYYATEGGAALTRFALDMHKASDTERADMLAILDEKRQREAATGNTFKFDDEVAPYFKDKQAALDEKDRVIAALTMSNTTTNLTTKEVSNMKTSTVNGAMAGIRAKSCEGQSPSKGKMTGGNAVMSCKESTKPV